MTKYRIWALIVLLIGVGVGFFVYSSEISEDSRFKFKYGLDLNGGTQLIYRADVSGVAQEDIDRSMEVLRQTIENRVNLFGVSEPLVQTEEGSAFSDERDRYRLIVELPGITNTQEAIDAIGQTPLLEFRLRKEDADLDALETQLLAEDVSPEMIKNLILSAYQPPAITGGDLERASLVFDQTTRQTLVTLQFNSEGSRRFEQLTGANIGRELAIFLDGNLISSPVIQQAISGGTAQINGNFTPNEARDLVNNLNFGALPLPLELLNTQTVGATLGQQTLLLGAQALLLSIIAISIFMVAYYRLPGLISAVALIFYCLVMMAIFKLVPVVLTAAGIAGLVLSVGMAVDANVLIFERIKEELDRKKALADAIKEGFDRAWSSIWDGNITGIIAGVILYWTANVPLVKGFALVLVIGIIVSMLSAMTVTKTLLLGISKQTLGPKGRFLYSKGITNIKK